MKLVLLSGGSGKRLWPLSNDARSKQFLKVLENDEGQLESMVQRVWGQLDRVGLAESSVIATSKSQIDMIQSQLGVEVPVIIEPERRDTFPAIALAATYLASELGVGAEEVVGVLPVDPFVEDRFFTRVVELEQALETSNADLALIGVTPMYPSEKYGYIVPEAAGDSCARQTAQASVNHFVRVSHFREKPQESVASDLIAQGALWNCGVFAFRLGRLLGLLEAKGLPTTYNELYAHYSDLPKISFDYEVVEKTEHIVALPYDGYWKDLGTWNTLTEEMGTKVIGKGVVSEDSLNTHLINELDIPVTILGLSDVVVAVSPDGILVTDKQASPRIKELIGHLDQRPMYEERRWGWYRVLDHSRTGDGREVLTKRIGVTAGKNLSYQLHHKRSEVWTIIGGSGLFAFEDEIRQVGPGDVLQIPVGAKHAIRALTDLEFIEVQAGSDLVEEDIVRLLMMWEEIEAHCAAVAVQVPAETASVEAASQSAASQRYFEWLNSPLIDDLTKEELHAMAGNAAEIEERFHKDLEFGTGGLRGVLGAGTNRINSYTIRRATQGLANTINSIGEAAKNRGVAIAYDSRHQSPELALEAACTLAANGIRVFLFESLRPTPELSFAVRHLGAQAGLVLTASHNPPEYNGYKVYGADGGQVVPAMAEAILAQIDKVPGVGGALTMSRAEAEEAGLLQWIGADVDDAYIARLQELVVDPDRLAVTAPELKVVYTPLHGAGNLPVRRVLRETGFTQVHVVKEQELPDPDFSTVASPNPEERVAFDLAVKLAQDIDADVILGTDPDCDRVGVVVRGASGAYEVLTGNQTGALLLHYLLSEKAKRGLLPDGGTLVKTIVTSELGRVIAERFGVESVDTLTGFKYIGEQMRLYEESGERTFLFGYEESYGYLAGTFVRDKDAVMASLLVCEMAAFYKAQGITLLDALEAIYREYGYYRETLISRTMKGIDGMAQMQRLLTAWREEPPVMIAGRTVVERRDYLAGQATFPVLEQTLSLSLPAENVLHYTLDDESWFCLRPSGTEPKMKVYVSVNGSSPAEVEGKLAALVEEIVQKLDGVPAVARV